MSTEDIAAIGLGLETDGIEKGIKALDVLASKGPAVEKSMASVEGAAAKTGKTLASLGAGTGKGLDEVAKKAAPAADGLKKVDSSADAAGKSVKGLGSAGAAGLDALNKAAATTSAGMRGVGAASTSADKSVRGLANAANEVTAALRVEAAALTGLQSGMASLNAANAAAAKSAQDFAKAMQSASEQTGRIREGADKGSAALGGLRQSATLAAQAFAAIGIGSAVKEYFQAADAVTSLNNSLRLATGGTQSASAAYESLFVIAQRSRVGFIELGNTFASISRATGELGISQSRMLKVTESIANAMTIGGGSAQGMNAALVQLSQGMASGTLRGEELNSILEQAPRLAKALADGLGVPIGKLREMGQAGEITSQQIVKALESQSAVLSKEVTGATLTLGQAFTQLTNSGTKAVGEFDRASGASTSLAQAISSIASAMDGMGTAFQNNETIIKTVMGSLAGAAALTTLAAVPRAIAAIGVAVTGLSAVLAANPIVLTLLGVGAVVGGGVAAVNAYSKTADGIKSAVRSLEEANTRSEAAMQRATAGGRVAGADNIRKTIEERQKAIRELNAELALMSNVGLDNRAEESRLAAGTEQMRAQQRAAEELSGIKQKLSGVDKDYLPTLNKLFAQYQSGSITLTEYQGLVSKLAQNNYKPEKVASGVKAEQSAYEGLVASIRTKIAANEAEINGAGRLTESDKLRIKLQEELAAGSKTLTASHKARALALLDILAAQEKEEARIKSLVVAYKQEAEIAEEIAQAYTAQSKAREAGRAGVDAYANGIDESNKSLQLELSLMGQSEQARNVALEQYRIELDLKKQLVAINENIGFNEAQREEERAKARAAAAIATANASSRAFLDEWKQSVDKYDDIFRQGFADMLNNGQDGWKSFTRSLATTFKTTVADQIYKMFAQPFVMKLVASLIGITGGGIVGTAASAVSGGSGILSTASSGLSLATGAFGQGFRAGISGLLGEAGLGGTISAGTTAIGAGNIAGGLGTLAGPLALVGGGILALTSILKATKGETRYGGGFEVVDGTAFRTTGDVTGTLPEGTILKSVQGTFDTINGLFKQYGSDFLATNIKAGIETSGKGRGGVFAGGLLSGGGLDNVKFGKFFEDRIGASLNPEEAVKAFGGELNKAVIAALQAATDLPKFVQRQIADVDVEALGADKAAELLQTIAGLPNVLLQGFGTTRDALVQQFAQGLATGDATAAGQSVADTLVASIEASLYTDAAGKIFDIVNNGIVAPMLDAIATGASVSEALSQATIDKTIERAKSQASALAELFGNAEFTAALESIRTTVGDALGQAGGSFGYTPKFQIEAAQQIDVAAQSASTAADEAARAAEEAARAWQDITDALLGDRSDAEIELLRAQGKEEAALAAERARSIVGYDAYQVSLYDGTQAIFRQIEALEKQAEAAEEAREKALELAQALASELPGVLDKFRTPEQRTEAQYGSIANDLIGAGLSGLGVGDLTKALIGAGKDDIAKAAVAIYNMTGVTDEMRLALVRAAGGLADLKDAAQATAFSNADSAYAALERSVGLQRTVLEETLSDVRGVFEAVRNASRELFGEVEGSAAMQAEQGRAFISQALASAQSTGYLPEGDQLNEAISAARSGLDAAVYASQAEADFQRLVLANELRDLQDISGDQLTEAEKQLEALDTILETAKSQLDALHGINSAVLSVADALSNFNAALSKASKGGGGGGGRTSAGGNPLPSWANFGVGDWIVNNSGSLVADATTGNIVGPGGIQGQRSTVLREVTALVESGQSMAVYDAIKASGFTLAQFDDFLGSGTTAEDWAKSMGLPIFHSGTSFVPQTGPALLERGEAVIPKAYNPAAGGTGGGNARLEALIEKLTEKVALVEAATNKTANNTGTASDVLVSVKNGNGLQFVAAPTF